MDIQFLHTKDCHVWKDALVVLEEALKESGQHVRYEVVVIENADQANQYKFLGSPTILVNGIDVDPSARNSTHYAISACRSYVFENKFYEYPPKEMIIDTLELHKNIKSRKRENLTPD